MALQITRTISRSRYREVPERMLIASRGAHGRAGGKKKMPKDGWVGMGWKYHIYDMAGRGALMRIEENVTDPVLRLSGSI